MPRVSDHPKGQPDSKADPKLGADWQQPQRKEEGRGWAKAKATTSDNTYTGKRGSKRDD
jgi:anti-sigma regulatory factor (Ser/Thr protein kinase)